MSEIKMYSADEICKELSITYVTLSNWYRWESKLLASGDVAEAYLPKPIKLENVKGRPRRWDETMLQELREFKKKVVVGRNGIYGAYSNPNHKNTAKYKKSLNCV